jgi:hypothetical protein
MASESHLLWSFSTHVFHHPVTFSELFQQVANGDLGMAIEAALVTLLVLSNMNLFKLVLSPIRVTQLHIHNYPICPFHTTHYHITQLIMPAFVPVSVLQLISEYYSLSVVRHCTIALNAPESFSRRS